MKNLIKITTALFLLVQSTGFSQSKTTEAATSTDDTAVKTEIPTEKFKNFIGTYFLEEGEFNLEIKEENNELYIVSPFSTDILTKVNDSTLSEDSRGVVLTLIKDDNSGLNFSQNGYETIIKRVKKK